MDCNFDQPNSATMVSPSPFNHSHFNRKMLYKPSKWWSTETVAVVTGANKGIGLAFVRTFAELGLTVILTARDINKGKEALESLKAQGLKHVEFCQLDVTDSLSVATFASWLQHRFGGLDILVNNAGVSFNALNENSVEHAETVMKTNFYGSKMLIETLMPLFRRSSTVSRILNLSSQLVLQTKVSNPALKTVIQAGDNLSEDMIHLMVSQFLDQVKRGVWRGQGWPKVWTDYSVSKLALSAYSKILAERNKGQNVSVNCFCPGFTRTEMTRGKGHRTPQEAAEVGVRIALLSPSELPTGEFFKIASPSLTSKL